jgi:hypothetical protein
LLGTRLVVWAWMSGCLRTAWPAFTLSACGVLGVATLAWGIYYRVAEVPDVGPAFDVDQFIASIPTIEANVAGEIIHAAGRNLKEHEKEVIDKTPRPKARLVLKRTMSFALADEEGALMGPGGPVPFMPPGGGGGAGGPGMAGASMAGDRGGSAGMAKVGGGGGIMSSAMGRRGWWQEAEEGTILRLVPTGTLPMPALTLASSITAFGLTFEPRSERDKAFAQDGAAASERAVEKQNVRGYYYQQLDDVLKHSWSEEATPEFDHWLEAMFKDKWSERLEELVKLPLGVVENPRNLNVGSRLPSLEYVRRIGQLVAVRALQLQAQGDHEGGLRLIATVLALSRNMRNKSPFLPYQVGIAEESEALQSLDRWLVGVGANRELLHKAAEELDRHARELPSFSDVYKAEYLITQNSLSEVYKWLDDYRPLKHEGGSLQELFRFVGSVPWEQKRRERILNAIYAGWLRGADDEFYLMEQRWSNSRPRPREEIDAGWLPASGGGRAASITPEKLSKWFRQSWLNIILGGYFGRSSWEVQGRSQFNVRGMRIKVAALLYQIDNGKQPEKLGDLAPRFLDKLPTDPFTGQPFDYRVLAEKENLLDTDIVANAGDAEIWSSTHSRDPAVRRIIVPRLKKP